MCLWAQSTHRHAMNTRVFGRVLNLAPTQAEYALGSPSSLSHNLLEFDVPFISLTQPSRIRVCAQLAAFAVLTGLTRLSFDRLHLSHTIFPSPSSEFARSSPPSPPSRASPGSHSIACISPTQSSPRPRLNLRAARRLRRPHGPHPALIRSPASLPHNLPLALV